MGAVIAAMLQAANPATKTVAMSMDSPDPMVPHPSGLYLLTRRQRAAANAAEFDVTVSDQAKTGGIFGYALAEGIASMSVKAAIQNDTARVKSSAKVPVFCFFFDESNPASPQASGWMPGTTQVATSPNEFTLIKLMKKKGRR